jgi:hypothetical protein
MKKWVYKLILVEKENQRNCEGRRPGANNN